MAVEAPFLSLSCGRRLTYVRAGKRSAESARNASALSDSLAARHQALGGCTTISTSRPDATALRVGPGQGAPQPPQAPAELRGGHDSEFLAGRSYAGCRTTPGDAAAARRAAERLLEVPPRAAFAIGIEVEHDSTDVARTSSRNAPAQAPNAATGRAGILARGQCAGDLWACPPPRSRALPPPPCCPGRRAWRRGGRHEQRGLGATRHRTRRPLSHRARARRRWHGHGVAGARPRARRKLAALTMMDPLAAGDDVRQRVACVRRRRGRGFGETPRRARDRGENPPRRAPGVHPRTAMESRAPRRC